MIPSPDELLNGFTVGQGRTRLCFRWRRCGADLYVHIAGEGEHLGAVALFGPGSGGRPGGGVLELAAHREGELVARAARRLQAALGGSVCVTAGIHLDAITPEEIHAVREHADAGVDRLLGLLGRSGALQSPHA